VELGTRGQRLKGLRFEVSLGKLLQETSISKITRAKWIGGLAEGAECLLCKCEDLSSNPSPTKNKEIQSVRFYGATNLKLLLV
jgi:hypothetical protein